MCGSWCRDQGNGQYRNSLQAGSSGVPSPVGARDFLISPSIHTSCEAHLASYTMSSQLFLGVMQLACAIDHPAPSNTEQSCIPTPSHVFKACCGQILYLFFFNYIQCFVFFTSTFILHVEVSQWLLVPATFYLLILCKVSKKKVYFF